ncbi:Xylan 1,4-beta-xylosidase [Pedobacter sp. Bi27]|uniref:glycoside hydrolase family 3 C-terminal domain-containing protein n=1 Tax=unclassified Pedobacter TaxID=2628915 RepID=UPI001DF7DAC1|nr:MULTISPECIES: glycoside hydrolase family 3 C-terminal domain-containing protein [unclassified Pedobacter]CAH0243045.1 Xylan 1,4-beta-xylosidase [Pedobacter sp. Bi27]CAH0280347.1 Xylan 1,4-beta-xylosidase [Pedobacter sp. Bi126]CAH0307206.1 Xylan 1,4-beta-xylosidase [Pedobacter sp. Bi36]
MPKPRRHLYLLPALFFCSSLFAQVKGQSLPYKNPKLSVDLRVKDLISRMTPEEKFWQLFMIPGDVTTENKTQFKNGIFGLQVSAAAQGSGNAQQMLTYNTSEDGLSLAKKVNEIQKFFVEETRLGIPIIPFDEALHGLVRQGATAFPQSIGLAASFDTTLVAKIGTAIANEARARGLRDLLAPVINMATDVRWGRVEETYGEDPYLTTVIGHAFMNAIERQNIIVTPKHFIANVGDGGRDSYPIEMDKHFLEEIHFPAFKDGVKNIGIRSLMTSYNSVFGTPATSNKWLLTTKLKTEWGFKGFVISDAGAVGGANVLHFTAKDYKDATAQSINAGLDVIFQVDYNHYKLFLPAFLDGGIPKSRIDDALSRVLKAKFELGLFEHPYVDESIAEKMLSDQSNHNLAKEAALKSFVLLKNDNNTLPLKSEKQILLVGEDAIEARLGGYSGTGNNKINILEGLKNAVSNNVKVNYVKGSSRELQSYIPVDSQFLSANQKAGLIGNYYKGLQFSGKPVKEVNDKAVNFSWTLYPPDEQLQLDDYSVRWAGKIKVPQNVDVNIGLEGNDGYRLYLDNQLLIDNWDKKSFNTKTVPFHFEKNKEYAIKVEFYEPKGNGKIKLIWDYNIKKSNEIADAVAAAKNNDAIVFVAGIKEGEFLDRAMLNLPGNQEMLLEELAKTGKPIIVVLTGGSAINMQPWLNKVNAVLDVWYPGEAGGSAIADVLLGKVNPSGKLPITYPIDESQLPLVYNHKPTGRGDDYNNLSGEPLFPFGYGLSYTNFSYHNLKFNRKSIAKNENANLSFELKNTGNYDGEEVVQLYMRPLLSKLAQPVLALRAFQRVHLKVGETKVISFKLDKEVLQTLNINNVWEVAPGEYRIMIGSSSKSLYLKDNLTVKP